jgi:hypothetical protein
MVSMGSMKGEVDSHKVCFAGNTFVNIKTVLCRQQPITAMKHVIREIMQALSLEREMFGECCESDDKREGTTSFLEKREPRFQDK